MGIRLNNFIKNILYKKRKRWIFLFKIKSIKRIKKERKRKGQRRRKLRRYIKMTILIII